ncbi:MAG: universal stress protein [Bacteroidales bacterium]|nr:universal stress protein [Bacteroidales bacterium]
MAQQQNYILVTWDFTEKSEFALEHAVIASRQLKFPIGLVHIVKKSSEVDAAERTIKEVIAKKFAQLDPAPTLFVRSGNIFSTISDLADELEAVMVFMGTHGMKGMQKVLGSWALKVIARTKVPFIVVQDKPTGNELFKKTVIPLTYRKENKECINWAAYFSRHFDTHYTIFRAHHTDQIFKKGIESNLLFLTKYFNSKGIPCDVEEAGTDADFVTQSVNYCIENGADSLMIMVTKDIGLTDYMLGAQEQRIIANEAKIPVICINPKPPKFGGSFSASGG